MSAGKLRHRLTVTGNVSVPAVDAGLTNSTTQTAYAHGRIIPVGALDLIHGQQVKEDATHRIVIRYRRAVDGWSEITGDGLRFRVLGVSHDDARRWSWIDALQLGPV